MSTSIKEVFFGFFEIFLFFFRFNLQNFQNQLIPSFLFYMSEGFVETYCGLAWVLSLSMILYHQLFTTFCYYWAVGLNKCWITNHRRLGYFFPYQHFVQNGYAIKKISASTGPRSLSSFPSLANGALYPRIRHSCHNAHLGATFNPCCFDTNKM